MKWNDDKTITITPPAKPKKITGTRFAAIMGLNKWTSPFNAWCAITRTYEEPFEDTIYTIAGKTIEPKQAEYMKTAYFMSNLITPTDVYGEDYFKKTWGDFFRDTPIFGGMWDYLLVDKEGKPQTVLEMKTTKRSEDWVEDVPEYYALQAALYAYGQAMVRYENDDYAPFIVIEMINICKQTGAYSDAIASYRRAMELPMVASSPSMLQDFQRNLDYITIVNQVLISHNEKGMPFGMIPAEYMAEIESEFQKKLTFTI